MKSTIEKDLLKSTVNLVDSTVLSTSDYTETSAYIINNLNDGHSVFQLVSVNSEYDGEMQVFIDGLKQCEFFIQKGVNQIPLSLKVKNQITTYFALDFKYEVETCLTENVKVKII
ncbi:MAG: hypothetical protein ABTA23_07955 [Solibacillus sp.]